MEPEPDRTRPDVAPRPWEWLLALSAGAVVAALNLLWLAAQPSLPGRDEAAYLAAAELLARMQAGEMPLASRAVQLYFHVAFGHPPLIHWVSLLGEGRVAPGPPGPSLAAHQVYYLVLAPAGLSLGSRVGGRAVGWMTVGLLLASPLALLAAHQFGPDFPLLAWTTVGLALLAASDHLERPAPVLLSGAALGLASLTKQPAALYLVPPALVLLLMRRGATGLRLLAAAVAAVVAGLVLHGGDPSAWPLALGGMAALGALARHARRRDPALAHLLGGALVAAALAGPWYLVHLRMHLEFFQEFFVLDTFSRVVEHEPFTAAGTLTVLGILATLALPPLVILAAPFGLWKHRRTPQGRWLAVSTGLLLLIVLALPTMHARYLVPLVAILAPAAALGLPRWLGAACIAAFLLGPFLALPARSVDEVFPRAATWLADGRMGSVLDARPADLDLRLPSPFGWAPAARPAWTRQAWDDLRPHAAGPPVQIRGQAPFPPALERLVQQWRIPALVTEGGDAPWQIAPAPEVDLEADARRRLDRYRLLPYPGPGPPGMLTLPGGSWVPVPAGSEFPWYARAPWDPPPPPLVTPEEQQPVPPGSPRPAGSPPR